MQAVGFGKIILFGEHAVVYGRPAVAMALGRGCTATAATTSDICDRLVLYPWGTAVAVPHDRGDLCHPASGTDPHADLLCRTFGTALVDLPEVRPALSVCARLAIPAGAGLGSSAAISVAVARAIDSALGRSRDEAALLSASMRWERVCHGNPSGIDSAMAVHGGVAEYRKGAPLSPLRLQQMPVVVVADSGVAPSTRLMVERVADRHRRDRTATERLFDGIETIVAAGRRALEAGDMVQLGELMTENQRLLVQLGLSTAALDELCREALAAGALGAKLTGGGGGGCMIAVCLDRASASRVEDSLRTRSRQTFVVEGTP